MTIRYTASLLLLAPYFLLLTAFSSGPNLPMGAAEMPPIFVDPTPADITVACVANVPAPVALMANDGMGGADFAVSPTDAPNPSSIDPCTGGVVVRSWSAIVGMDTTTVRQNITILPDGVAPVANIPVRNEVVDCAQALPSAPNNPNRYDTWLSSLRLTLSSNATDNCGGGVTINDNGSGVFTQSCGMRTITFTMSDGCNNTSNYVATYTSVDNVAPVFIGIPPSDTISCTDPVPPVPTVTVMDNCTNNLVPLFAQATNRTMNGSETDYEYTILRTWVVSDSCSNTNVKTQFIYVLDTEPPSFTRPTDLTISCSADPDDLTVTGMPTNLMDNCVPIEDLIVDYSDFVINGNCEDDRTIIRQWTVRDLSGNTAVNQQIINVADLSGPTFTVPMDIVVDCRQADNLATTGQPTNLADDCDPDPTVTYFDQLFPGTCPNNYRIRRTWTAVDRCDNPTSMIQEIIVQDSEVPVFTEAPTDLVISCATGVDIAATFADWVSNRAGATATDNCTATGDIVWRIYNTGTTDAPTLLTTNCPTPDQAVQLAVVDFIVLDECGLSDTITAMFRVLDQTAPSLSNCPDDLVIATDAGLCAANVTLVPPVIEDGCSLVATPATATASKILTAQAAPGQEGEVAVDPIDLNLTIATPLPINATAPATLTVSLLTVDGESPEEYFRVYGEDGTLLGQTTPTANQCGNGTTTFTLSVAQVNTWGADGSVALRFEPNIPAGQPERFAINANCPIASRVQADLAYNTNTLGGIVYAYSINGGARVQVSPVGATDVTLAQGSHQIQYFVTDCAGNSDSCAYTIMVVDQEAPTLTCPAPVTVNVAADSCQFTLTLPTPVGATDNCAVYNQYERTLPATIEDAQLRFFLDPNLNDYLPQGTTFSFDDVAANAFGNVTLLVEMQGDFNTNGAFFTVLGDDGSTLATSTLGVADCNTPGQISITIPAVTFNTWAQDGAVDIQIVPNDITVPPGVLGDGINPCDPSAIMNDGDTDGITYIRATLGYGNLLTQYFATGATPLAQAMLPEPEGTVTATFNVGQTQVHYLTEDLAGNASECSFTVNVRDVTPPEVRCQPTNLFINPSGLQVEVVNATSVDAGSFDNCGTIDSLWLSPNVFTCAQVGQIVNVTLRARDASGNIGTCQTIVGIAPLNPSPTANSGLCGGDTLFLFANPPAPSPNVYTYQWFSPTGAPLSPPGPNPDLIIPSITVANEGPYRVVITGLTGCTSEGVVNVSIQDLPLTPTLNVVGSACTNDVFRLETPFIPAGSNVRFYWYEGVAPNGALLGTTTVPMFSVAGPHTPGVHTYYMQVEANGCLSPSSMLRNITIYERPVASVAFADTLVCAGTMVTLGAAPQANATYRWTGPNGYVANIQFPNTNSLTTATAGYYYLTVNRELCVSAPDSTLVTVKPRPAQPTLASNAPICAGEALVLTTPVTGVGTYRWIRPNGLPITTTTPSYTVPVASATDQGLWQLVVSSNGCDSPASPNIGVAINPAPDASAMITPNPACQGNNIQLSGFSTVAGSTFRWSGPNSYTSQVQQPVIGNVTLSRAGTYKLVTTTNAGCKDSTTVDLTVLSGVQVTGLSDNVPACVEEGFDVLITSAVLPVDNGSYTYQWRFNGMVVANTPNLAIPNAEPADAGVYTFEAFTAEGCSSGTSSITLDLNFTPPQPTQPVTLSGRTSYCQGENFTLITSAISGQNVSYYWETPAGVIVTGDNMLAVEDINSGNSGMYRVYVIRNGCASTLSPPRMITVNPIPTITLNSNTPVCAGNSIALQSTSYPTGIYTWSGPGGFGNGVAVHNPVISNADSLLHSGTYRVFVEVAGCVSDTVTATVVVRNRPPVPTVAHDAPVCLDNPDAVLTLSVTPATVVEGATYTWFTQNGNAQLAPPSTATSLEVIDFSMFAAGGLFPFYATATRDGCVSLLSNPTLVQFDTIPINAAFAGVDTTVCSGQFILRGAMPTVGTGLWTLVSATDPMGFSLANPDAANSIVTGLTNTGAPYTLRWTLTNGACRNYSSDEVTLDIVVPEQAIAGSDLLACEDEMIVLGATPPSSDCVGYWTQDITQRTLGVVIVDSLDANTEVLNLNSDNVYFFTWVVDCVCGQSSQTIFVNISDPSVLAGGDFIVCDETNQTQLSGEIPNTGSSIRWYTLNAGVTISDAAAPRPIVSNLQEGENVFVLEVDQGFCGPTSLDTVSVFYKIPPMVSDDTYSVPFGGALDVQPLSNDIVPMGTSISIAESPDLGNAVLAGANVIKYTAPANFVGVEEMTYTIASEGCTPENGRITFIVGEGAACQVPSIFTPNGDDYNDKFVIPCLLDRSEYPRSSVLIYNRWGDEIYRSAKPYNNNWDGTYNGEDLPADTYFYIIDLGDGSEPMKGYVMIQR
jgi:gliding motility-associated-like protein